MGKIYFGKDPIAIYHEGVNTIPTGAVEITKQEFDALFEAQRGGATIQADKKGKPIAVFPPSPSASTLKDRLVRLVKSEAFRRIELIAPIWKQLNALRGQGTIDVAAIDAIRANSNKAEQALLAMNDEQSQLFNPLDDKWWA